MISTGSLKREKETDSSSFSPSRQHVKAFAREAIYGFLLLGQLIISHEVGENPAILFVVDGLLNVPRDDHLQLMHQILQVVAHVVGKVRRNGNSSPRRRKVAHHVRAVEEALDPPPEIGRPPFLVGEPHRLAKGILRDDVGRVAVESLLDIEHTFCAEELVAGALREVVDLALELEHLGPGEEPVHGEPPRPVELVRCGREAADEDRTRGARVQKVLPLVPLPVAGGVDLVDETGIVAVQLFGVDSHYGA